MLAAWTTTSGMVSLKRSPERRAVGAPVVTPQTGVVGAIAVSGPTARLSGERFEETIPDVVVQAANICEINLQTVETASEKPV